MSRRAGYVLTKFNIYVFIFIMQINYIGWVIFFSAILLREQVTPRWEEDDVRFVID